MRLTALPALGLLAVVGASVPAPAQARADSYDCSQISATDQRVTDTSDSLPLELLGIEAAHQVIETDGRVPREPVAVAVIDSGVSTRSGLIDVAERVSFAGPTVEEGHGTEVAGLIAGHARPGDKGIGVAPDARIVDVQVYDQAVPSDGQVGVGTDGVVQGLNWVADNAKRLNIKVANVSLAVSADDHGELADAVRNVRKAGVVLVAASGNRPQDEADSLYEKFGDGGSETGPGEDAAADVFPAGYRSVVAVNATTAGLAGAGAAKDYVLANTATDVAAPTYGGVSIAINGSTCRVTEVATSFAAAEVSGVFALLRSHFPDDNVAQSVARLENTADGTTDDPTPYQGVGVVQPVEALTRPLHPDSTGAVDRTTPEQGGDERATAPEPAADVLSRTRRNAVWWGLLGGGALLLALLLRPVLARRRE